MNVYRGSYRWCMGTRLRAPFESFRKDKESTETTLIFWLSHKDKKGTKEDFY